MINKLIVLVGMSASGKTTLANLIAREENAVPVFVSKLIRERAVKEGFKGLTDYFAHYGVENGFKNVRPKIHEQIVTALKLGNVVVEGVYDMKLFDGLVKELGRKNLFVVNLAGGRQVREHRFGLSHGLSSHQAKKRVRERDEFKWDAGLRFISRQADVKLRSNTVHETLTLFKQAWEKFK